MVALQRFGTGESPVASAKLNLIVDALTGAGNTPVNHGGVNDPVNYSLTLRNQDPAGKVAVLYAPNGSTVLLQVTAAGVIASPDGVAAAAPILTSNSNLSGANLGAGSVTSAKLALTEVNSSLPADTALTLATGNLLTTIALTAGTWEIWGQAKVSNLSAGNSLVSVYARDDTAGILIPQSAAAGTVAPGVDGSFSFSTRYAPAGAVTVSLRCFPSSNTVTARAQDGNVALACTYIRALRIG